MGYDKANQGWWISWVPEIGRFEINVANRDELSQLNSFWAIAPNQYSYQVLLKDGTFIHQRNALRKSPHLAPQLLKLPANHAQAIQRS